MLEDQGQGEKKTDYSFSDFLEDEIRDTSFKVSIKPHRIIPHVILIIVPIVFYIMFKPFLDLLEGVEMWSMAGVFEFVLFFVFILGIFFLFYNCGKELVVSGHGIVVRKFFFIYDSFNISDVERCEVITGLVTSGKIHEHYSKFVIYYGEGRKFYMEDNLFKGWQRLVRYMEMNGKAVHIDGRSAFSKFMDGM